MRVERARAYLTPWFVFVIAPLGSFASLCQFVSWLS